MTGQESPSANVDESLKHWRQGDFAWDVGGFLFASPADGDDAFDASEANENIVGLILISQSCDIVRRTGGRHYVAVAPLVNLSEEELSAAQKGRRPYLTNVENAGNAVFADLARVMSVHKEVVANWEHRPGFSSEAGRLRFAAALERKFGQFAFPDDFNFSMKRFCERVWSRHDRTDSTPGKVYRSLAQIRFRAQPDWTGDNRRMLVIAIMKNEEDCEVGREVISEELENILSRIAWPHGYEWQDTETKFWLATASELSAEDLLTSQRGDFDFLCY